MSPLKLYWTSVVVTVSAVAVIAVFWPPILWTLVVGAPLLLVGTWDTFQRRHAVRRNFPLVGHFRYLLEAIRPEIQQYFIESESSGRPFSHEVRSVVYQRSKNAIDTRPFGTVRNLYEVGTELLAHSLNCIPPPTVPPRIVIGAAKCAQPYSASMLNISAMSFGALSSAAIRALNGGAKDGGFFHNTGEGGISPHHLEPGGDLCWQLGTGYFGARTADGAFDPDAFAEKAAWPQVRMIEIKLSQGAKPGHGGILPGAKVTAEIAAIRGVEIGRTVHSPPAHSVFSSPRGLCRFIGQLRELAGGKPIGFKLCIGLVSEFFSICKAMLETGEHPDFITVDGAEGGTGAAPLEFSNSIGAPLTEGLIIVHNGLVGVGLREEIKVIASGRIATGFDIVQRIAIGADLCSAARPMMFALGCIQALRCNTNQCPVGVATQKPGLVRGLDVADKRTRVRNFHHNTVHAAMEILGAAGLDHPDQLTPSHIFKRLSTTSIATYEEIYDYFESGDLLAGKYGKRQSEYDAMFARAWERASADRF